MKVLGGRDRHQRAAAREACCAYVWDDDSEGFELSQLREQLELERRSKAERRRLPELESCLARG